MGLSPAIVQITLMAAAYHSPMLVHGGEIAPEICEPTKRCPTAGDTCKKKATLEPFGMEFFNHMLCGVDGVVKINYCKHEGQNIASTVCRKQDGAIADSCTRELWPVSDPAKAKEDKLLDVYSVGPSRVIKKRTKLGSVVCSEAAGTEIAK